MSIKHNWETFLRNNYGNLFTTNVGSNQGTGTRTFSTLVTIPPFLPSNLRLWFAQIEAVFDMLNVTEDSHKYGYVINGLDPNYADAVTPVIADPPKTGKYEAIKNCLMKRYGISHEEHIKQLEKEEMGRRTPSQFLEHLRRIAREGVQEIFIKSVWMKGLPQEIQRLLATLPEMLPVENMAATADTALEMLTKKQNAPQIKSLLTIPPPLMPPTTATEDMKKKMLTLKNRMNKLESLVRMSLKGKSRGTFQGRGSRSASEIPWYEDEFDMPDPDCIQIP